MADGRQNNGGARPGAGRKTKAEILGLADLIDSTWSETRQKAVIKKLAKDCEDGDFHTRHEARKLLLAYKFGKPTEKHVHSGPDDGPIEHKQFVVRIIDGSDSTSTGNSNE